MDNQNHYDYNNNYNNNLNNQNYYNNQPGQNPYEPPKPNGFATASFVLGILSLVISCCFFISIPLGTLAVLFAILSKGASSHITGRAKTGLWLGIGGLALTILLTTVLISKSGWRNFTNEFYNYYDDSYYSDSFNDWYGNESYQDASPQKSLPNVGDSL